jgi:hypothetical protein
MNKPTVIFDFDGVIHSYKSGWNGATVIPDEPVPGIREAIVEIRNHYRVVVVSTRCYQEGGIDAIHDWLLDHNIPVDDVTSEKPPAIVQIDDRAIKFDGNPNQLLSKIRSFQPWYKEELACEDEAPPPFKGWAWMESWINAYEQQVGDGKAKEFYDWVGHQPMQG